jgi:hypothetical protein
MKKCPLCGHKLIEEEIMVNGQATIEIRCSNRKCVFMRLE